MENTPAADQYLLRDTFRSSVGPDYRRRDGHDGASGRSVSDDLFVPDDTRSRLSILKRADKA